MSGKMYWLAQKKKKIVIFFGRMAISPFLSLDKKEIEEKNKQAVKMKIRLCIFFVGLEQMNCFEPMAKSLRPGH